VLLLLLLLLQELTGMWESNVWCVLPEGECELLYGAAGYLYSLTWLQTQLGADVVPASLCKVWIALGAGDFLGEKVTGQVLLNEAVLQTWRCSKEWWVLAHVAWFSGLPRYRQAHGPPPPPPRPPRARHHNHPPPI
jgi:hypothetical protein